MSLLSHINEPADLKKLTAAQLNTLAGEIREFLIQHVSQTGGHLSSNLGVVELTLALHYVFNSPEDKIIFDVGHQAYVHKILTGRKDQFDSLRQKDGLSGFTRRYESEHDIINTGHASNSISFGLGMLAANHIKGDRNKVICVIGDGGLTGGMALSALNNAGHMNKNLIVIVNDNNMSISKNVGALHNYLSRLTTTGQYDKIRRFFDRYLSHIPFLGKFLYSVLRRLKRGVKGLFFKQTLFSDLGFEYVGPIHGHHIKDLISVLKNASIIDRPVVVHTVTEKGHGYPPAMQQPSLYHGVTPFDTRTGLMKSPASPAKTFTNIVSETLIEAARKDDRIVAITAAMPDGTGLSAFARHFPSRFFDVGIAEEHAVTFASGLALSGMKPVAAIYSTFIQRAVDQVIHDVAMQGASRVVFLMDRAGFVPADGENHQGLYDISIFRGIPNLNVLAPATGNELQAMILWALRQKRSTLIRYPKDHIPPEELGCEEAIHLGRGVFVRQHKGAPILFISVGAVLSEVLSATDILKEKHKINCDIFNLRFIAPLGEEELGEIMRNYKVVIVVEEASKIGGVGEQIAQIAVHMRHPLLFRHLGAPSEFLRAGTREELLKAGGLHHQNIARTALKTYKDARVRQYASKIAVGKIIS